MIIYSPTFTGSVQITGSQTVTGDLTVQGNLTAQTFILSSSVSYFTESFASGSTRFGDSMDDTMKVTGSLLLTGSLGIGTANPGNNLHIVSTTGSFKIESTATTAGCIPFIDFVHAGNDSFRITGGSDLRFLTSGVTERMRIANGGNVGIGSSTPGAQVTIASNQGNTNSYNWLTFRNLSSGYGCWGFAKSGSNDLALQYDTSTDVPSSNPPAMYWKYGGNVGIGITNPEAQLHIATNVASATNNMLYLYNSDYAATTRTFVRVRNNISVGSTYSSYFGQGADGKTYIIANDTSRNDIVIKGDNGYVGIGTNNPQVLFEVSDSSSNTIMVVRNNSNANTTGKNAMYGFYGTDTANSIKGVGGMQAVPNDVNWVNGFLYWYTRASDSQALRMSLSSGGALVISGALTQNGSPSDINLKENLVKISSPLDKISQINGYSFEWKEGSPARGNISNIVEDAGVIAQEIETILPEIVRVSDEHKVVNYNGLVALLIEGMKELKAEIEELKNK